MNKTNSSIKSSKKKNDSKEYNKYSLEEINNFISTVETHLATSVKEGKFVEADLLKKKLDQLNKVKKERAYEEIVKHQEQRKELLIQEQKEELDSFNARMDQKYNEITQSTTDFDSAFSERSQKELDEAIEQFNSTYPPNPKPSKALLVLNAQLDLYVKKANYQLAHEKQNEIQALSEKEMQVFQEEKQKKLNVETDKIKRRQDNEYKVQKEKLTLVYTEFKKERAVKVEEMMMKYKNKLTEMDNAHRYELSNFNKCYVGASKQNNRANSRLSAENQKKLVTNLSIEANQTEA